MSLNACNADRYCTTLDEIILKSVGILDGEVAPGFPPLPRIEGLATSQEPTAAAETGLELLLAVDLRLS